MQAMTHQICKNDLVLHKLLSKKELYDFVCLWDPTFRLSTKSLFPVQRVAVIVASRAAAIFSTFYFV